MLLCGIAGASRAGKKGGHMEHIVDSLGRAVSRLIVKGGYAINMWHAVRPDGDEVWVYHTSPEGRGTCWFEGSAPTKEGAIFWCLWEIARYRSGHLGHRAIRE